MHQPALWIRSQLCQPTPCPAVTKLRLCRPSCASATWQGFRRTLPRIFLSVQRVSCLPGSVMKQRSRLPDKRYSKAHDAYLAADAADIPQPDKTRFTRDGHSAPVTSSRAEQSQSKPDCTSTATKPKGNSMATFNEMFPKRFFNCENTPPGGITLTVKAVYEGVVNKQTEEEGWIMSFHESEMEYPLKPEATGILFNELDAYDN